MKLLVVVRSRSASSRWPSACSAVGCQGRTKVSTQGQPVTAEEFDRIFRENSNWGRWGEEDALGTINLMTDAKRKQAAALVKMGITASVAHDLGTEESPDDPAGRFRQEVAPNFRVNTRHCKFLAGRAA